MEDLHESMSWWACFHEQESAKPEPDFSHPFYDAPNRISTEAQKRKNQKAKKRKRKQTKASIRKNRRH